MGGICTLIGTPPNLLISGFYTEQTGIQLSIFTPTLVGLFCLAVGILSMIVMQKMVPVRKSPEDALEETNDYTVELLVPFSRMHRENGEGSRTGRSGRRTPD